MDYLRCLFLFENGGDAMYITPREEDVKKIREEGMYVILVKWVLYKAVEEVREVLHRTILFGSPPEIPENMYKK